MCRSLDFRGLLSNAVATAFAILLFLAPLSLSPMHNEDETQQAVRLAIAKRYDEALEILFRRLARQPKDAQLNYLAGICYLQKEELERAARFLEVSVAERPRFPNPYLWLAVVYRRLDKPAQALQTVSEGLQRFPRHRPLLELKDELGGEREPQPSGFGP